MLTEFELKAAGETTSKLHEFYMIIHSQGKQTIIIQYMEKHFLSASKYLLVTWGDLYDVFNFSQLGTSLMRCWAL
jgi:hypothetical protein